MFSKRVYLDYAAATPVDKRVFKAMERFFSKQFYNPQALYDGAVSVSKVIEEARKKVAKVCGCRSQEVIFTASGTESNNLAIRGIVKKFIKNYPQIKPKIITTPIEHPSVLEVLEDLGEEIEIHYLKISATGQIDIQELINELDERVVLVSVMLANNEIGTIMPIRRITSEIRKYKNKNALPVSHHPYLHTDASQCPCFMSVNLNSLGADLLVMDGSKIYGPKGVGVLIKKSYVEIDSVIKGGGQERGLRAGTENTPLIVGFAEALCLADDQKEKDSKRLTALRDYFIEQVLKKYPEVYLNGDRTERLPNNVNFCISGLHAEFAVIKLSQLGIDCSSVTACKNISDETRSYVVDALGGRCGASSLRFTLGRQTKKSDIDFVIGALKKIIDTVKD